MYKIKKKINLISRIDFKNLELRLSHTVDGEPLELAPPNQLPEFQVVCRIYLGRFGEYAYICAANTIIFGCLMAYFVLMSKFLFGAGLSIHKLRNRGRHDNEIVKNLHIGLSKSS